MLNEFFMKTISSTDLQKKASDMNYTTAAIEAGNRLSL
jgi:hypothetical protein